jgi:hypothetical protein
MHLLSHFLFINLHSSFTRFSLSLCTLHTHYRILLAALCGIQNLSLGVCPSWSSFLYFISRMLLELAPPHNNGLLTGQEAVHQSALFAFLSMPSWLHHHLLQVPLPDPSPMVRIDCQQSHHQEHRWHLLG